MIQTHEKAHLPRSPPGDPRNDWFCLHGYKTLLKMEYLKLHFEWLKAGEMPNQGLCFSLIDDDSNRLDLFKPSEDDGHDGMNNVWYWGHGNFEKGQLQHIWHLLEYTALRQNIVLFLAAMNGEL